MINRVFYGCTKLSFIDISSFNSIPIYSELFIGVAEIGTIIIRNEDIVEKLDIPKNWEVEKIE